MADKKIKGLTVEIGGDTTKLGKQVLSIIMRNIAQQ